ncbi:cathepsin B-like [Pectinophora gossypiella]|uniref:cathepsin B-like n=1 Tax=Pectinophora gossypiella TaxID=13191 RepID=UPI00214EEBE9|nr:cathepsin B-like [Pectinophora gossypiella]
MLRLLVLALATFVSCDFDEELHNKYLSMPHDEFVEYFNSRNYSYTIKAYDFDPVVGMVKTFIPEGIPVISYNDSSVADLPENFDSREKWSHCATIGEIHNQGKCGSCWTFGTSNTASDRTCIHKGVTVRLSQQDFNCFSKDVCRGGYPNEAFEFYVSTGLVTQECKPYDIEFLKKRQCDKKCVNGADYAGDKHRGSSVKAVNSEEGTIKAELFKNGPIQAAFSVYEDFKKYEGGIYEHKYGELLGGHSVRLIGYGVENNVPYWLVANSWGTGWGEKGFFRIKRYGKDVEFENYLCTVFP